MQPSLKGPRTASSLKAQRKISKQMWAGQSHCIIFALCALHTFPSTFQLLLSPPDLGHWSHWAAQLWSSRGEHHHLPSPATPSLSHPSLAEDYGLRILASNLFLWPSPHDLTLTQKPTAIAESRGADFQSMHTAGLLVAWLCCFMQWKKVKNNLRKKMFDFVSQCENTVHGDR